MCDYILKRGKNKGVKCEKKPIVDSTYCCLHKPKEKKKEVDGDTITIQLPKNIIDKLNYDTLNQVCMTTVIDIFNEIKKQSGMKTSMFSIEELSDKNDLE